MSWLDVETLLKRKGPADRMVALLKRPQGAQIAEMASATGWSVTLVRSALAMVMRRKGRIAVRSHRQGDVRIYALSPELEL